MKINSFIFLFKIIFFCVFSLQIQAQIIGNTKETYSGQPLPFVHITINDSIQTLSDIQGVFVIPDSINWIKIVFSKNQYRNIEILKSNQIFSDSILFSSIKLNYAMPFSYIEKTGLLEKELILKTLTNKDKNNPDFKGDYSYKTYSKLLIDYKADEETELLLRSILKYFFKRMKSFEGKHHLLLMESATKKNYHNYFSQNEKIEGNQISGVKDPSYFALNSQMQVYSIYNNYVSFAFNTFLGPMHKGTLKRYQFEIVDVVNRKKDSLYVIKFIPKKGKIFDAIKGYLYINTKDYAIEGFEIQPDLDLVFDMKIVQQSKLLDGKYFPTQTATKLKFESSKNSRITFSALGETFYSETKTENKFKKKDFSEFITKYDTNFQNKDSTFWKSRRKIDFDSIDQNTLKFYDKLGKIRSLEKFFRLGERLYQGQIPINIFNIETNRILTFNIYENTRVGFGVNTNDRFSAKWKFGAFAGYGIDDKQYKYGGLIEHTFNTINQTKLELNYKYDLEESGAMPSLSNLYQFSSEPLRKYMVSYFDYAQKMSFGFQSRISKYFHLNSSLHYFDKTPTFKYVFNNSELNSKYTFNEFKIGVKYAFGEQLIQMQNQVFSLGSLYPCFYFQYTQGFKSFLLGEFDYQKIDLRIEHSFNIIGLGKTYWQLNAGYILGDIPYSLLYVAKASFRNFSPLIHNSFETMRYNEFVSDKFLSLHFSHYFGRIKIWKNKIAPQIEWLHNLGFGSLSNPDSHKEISTKSFEKIYLETGLFINDVLRINLSGLYLGLGGGIFYRYGEYAFPNQKDNIVGKMSFNFYF